jgi:hypothetical protein
MGGWGPGQGPPSCWHEVALRASVKGTCLYQSRKGVELGLRQQVGALLGAGRDHERGASRGVGAKVLQHVAEGLHGGRGGVNFKVKVGKTFDVRGP